ncbi:unnamed protein product [Ambrosiozyma monospora]|uniref:Unnamed protein product n=1 Tax=Ambrosiozyma monospora TaxID=43982 RepID=A0ACB5SYS1_AMBMO|nr:unnamed protein product [Ambrosiozyma monospora]
MGALRLFSSGELNGGNYSKQINYFDKKPQQQISEQINGKEYNQENSNGADADGYLTLRFEDDFISSYEAFADQYT